MPKPQTKKGKGLRVKAKGLSLLVILSICLAPACPAAVKTPDKKTGPAPKRAAEPAKTAPARPESRLAEREIRKGDLEVYTNVTGIATAQDAYDIFAPFDGRVEEIMFELFDFVTPMDTAASMVSTEMAALLDSTTPENRAQAERRWQDVYKYHDVKPESPGLVTNIYVSPKTRVSKGERLFTVARKVVITGRNTDPLYSPLTPGMTAEVSCDKDESVKLQTALTSFIPVQGSPLYNRVWLQAGKLRSGIRIGERFSGSLFVGRSEDTRVVPRTSLLEKNGRKYLILEVETGLSTAEEIEITKSGMHFLDPSYGKDKKTK